MVYYLNSLKGTDFVICYTLFVITTYNGFYSPFENFRGGREDGGLKINSCLSPEGASLPALPTGRQAAGRFELFNPIDYFRAVSDCEC